MELHSAGYKAVRFMVNEVEFPFQAIQASGHCTLWQRVPHASLASHETILFCLTWASCLYNNIHGMTFTAYE